MVENTLLREYSKIGPALSILGRIGNGRRTYGELRDAFDQRNTGNLSRWLAKMTANDALIRSCPINDRDNPRKAFYSISDNLFRFYFAYLLRSDDYVTANSNGFFDRMITPSLTTFVSYRFEEIAKAYFHRMAKEGLRDDILRIGSYWYDDRKSRKNGEFDVALETYDGYEIYECKFLEAKAASSLVRSEKRNVEEIEGIHASKFGFISSSGFEEEIDGVTLISGEDIYGI